MESEENALDSGTLGWTKPALFCNCAHQKPGKIFADTANCQCLMSAFRDVRKYHKFRLLALAIMPEHWHAVLWPYSGVSIETVVGAVKQNMLRQVWVQQKRTSFWQDRFFGSSASQ